MRLLLLLYLVFSPLLSDFSSPQFPLEGRTPLDQFLLVKPFDYRLVNWRFQTRGSSVLTTMDEIRLTSDNKNKTGSIWARQGLRLKAFAVEARLRISSSRTVVGDGMGIWFTEEILSAGNAYGITPLFTGFGVILDIYGNTSWARTPFLALVASDGTTGLAITDDGNSLTLRRCRLHAKKSLIREANHNSREIEILIEYLPDKMGVYYKLEHDLDWQPCLTYKNISNPYHFTLGVSASTSEHTAKQELLSLKVFNLSIDTTVKPRSSMHSTTTDEGDKKTSEIFVIVSTLAFAIVIGSLIYFIIKRNRTPRLNRQEEETPLRDVVVQK